MPSANRESLTTRFVEALPASDREIVVWDRELPGFGLRVSSLGVEGLHGAQAVGREVPARHHRPPRGLVPGCRAARGRGNHREPQERRNAGTRPGRRTAPPAVRRSRRLAEQYMAEHVAVRCKPTTARSCRHIFDKYLLPQFGRKRLGEIRPEQVAALHYRLREKATTANQVVGLLSRLFHKAAKSGYAPAGGNPCRFIKKYPTRSCERFLSEREFVRLGTVLDELEADGQDRDYGGGRAPPADADRVPTQ